MLNSNASALDRLAATFQAALELAAEGDARSGYLLLQEELRLAQEAGRAAAELEPYRDAIRMYREWCPQIQVN